MTEQLTVVVAWYRRADYDRIRALADDGGGMDPTFGQWQKQAQNKLAGLRAKGFIVRKIVIDPDDFAAWLNAVDVKSNEQTRAAYAALVAQREEG